MMIPLSTYNLCVVFPQKKQNQSLMLINTLMQKSIVQQVVKHFLTIRIGEGTFQGVHTKVTLLKIAKQRV